MSADSKYPPPGTPRKADNLALIGFMGSGKSAVGPLLAEKLGMAFVELDAVVEAGAGRNIEDIFSSEGESGFRVRESEALAEVLKGSGKVVSCGGGAVLREENVRMLRQGCRIFLLRVSRSTAVRRLRKEGGRPLLAGVDLEDKVARLMDERAEKYAAAAHEIIDADMASPEEIAEEIAARWRRYT